MANWKILVLVGALGMIACQGGASTDDLAADDVRDVSGADGANEDVGPGTDVPADLPAPDAQDVPGDLPEADEGDGEVDSGPDVTGDLPATDEGDGDADSGDTVADVAVDVGLAEVRTPAALDEYLGIADMPVMNDTGFFRTALLEGRWVLATPAGHAFLSFGPTTLDFSGDVGRGMTYSSYLLSNRARWGDDDAGRSRYLDSALARLRESGFNTVGGWSDEAARRIAQRQVTPIPYTVSLEFSRRGTGVNKDGFPDVFDPAFALACRNYAASATSAFREDPFLVGYYTDNELKWWGEGLFWEVEGGNLADDFLRLPSEAPGKQAWGTFLREDRGYDIAALNAAWGTAFATWDEVTAATVLAYDAAWPKRAADKVAFVGRVAREYFEVVDTALRAADPNHLNLCVRFASTAPLEVAAAAAPCDVLTINDYYTDDDEFTAGLFRATPEERWTGFALAAGGGTTPKPAMLTEFGLRGTDSMLPNGFGAGFVGATQGERGAYYRRVLDRLLGFSSAGVGFVFGFHWFEWRDEPKTGRWDGEDSNYGLVASDGTPYAVLWEAMASQHAMVIDRLLGGSAPVLATPVVRAATGVDGFPVLEWDPVPGAAEYVVRLAPAPWMPGEAPLPLLSDPLMQGPAETVSTVLDTSWRLPEGQAAGTRWVAVTAIHSGWAFPSDSSTPLRVEAPRSCAASREGPGTPEGCFTNPAPMDAMRDDGWASAAAVDVAGEPWMWLRFQGSALASSHPRNGGSGTEIVISYQPPTPLPPDGLPRFCASTVLAADGVREPASTFLVLRLRGADGAILAEGPLDPDGTVAPGACQAVAPVASGPVARVEWVLSTSNPRLALDVPVEVRVGPLP